MFVRIRSFLGCMKTNTRYALFEQTTQPTTFARRLPSDSRPQETEACRIRKKVRDRAILIGQTRPAPLILVDATRGKGVA